MSQSMAEDQLFIENIKKSEQKKKKDEKIVEKIESLDDKVSRYNNKEQEELQRLESTKTYYRRIRLSAERRIQTEVSALEARIEKIKQKADAEVTAIESRIEKVKQSIEETISYADQMLEKVDLREEIFKTGINKQVKKTESRKESLVNSIHTPSLKRQAEAFLEKKPEPEPELEPESETKSETESESKEKAPPPKPVKMAPKQQGVQQPKIITNTKRVKLAEDHQREQEEYAKRDEAESKKSKLADLTMKIRIAKNQLVTLERQVNRDEDKIREKEVEVNSLKEEYRFLESSIPAAYRR